ncbi:MAG: hypothetical protein WHT06_03975 [Desulfobacterales bacterium]
MISSDCRFVDFLRWANGRSAEEILRLAEEEATRAERLSLRSRGGSVGERCGEDYAERLKQLIDYLRFSIKPRRPIADPGWLSSLNSAGPPPRKSPPPVSGNTVS